MLLNESAKMLISLLHSAGYKAYAVGGCVRDFLLNRAVNDIDICTSATPEEVENVLKNKGIKFVETGLKHGTITAVVNGKPYEITTFRTDGEYLDNRRPENVTFVTDVKDDLARRDFTINSMAYNEQEGLVDCFGGVEDLKNKLIRAVGDADTRFNEDALRIMRALRFSAVLGFDIEESTKNAIIKNKELLLNIAAERIYAELIKLLMGDYCEKVLLDYREVIAVIIPEIEPCFDFPQNSKWHIYDVYTHTVKSTAIAPKTDYMRLSMFLHDIGKPFCKTTDENGQDHFKGHAIVSAEKAYDILKRLKVSNEVLNKSVALIENHAKYITERSSVIKSWLRKLGEDLTFDYIDFKIADLSTHNPEYSESEIETLKEIKLKTQRIIESGEPYKISDLKINGNDLIRLGYTGKAIQDELELLVLEVSGNPILNTREKLFSMALRDYKPKN